ncbi:M23 family metallopeptidase [Candidatus Woesearchaeota archaeon]|nr:M23 family metallopeptidase [Candidatus Woesearchaeota archaeon]
MKTRIRSGRRALIFVPFVVIMLLAALITALVLLSQKGDPFNERFIGMSQYEVIDAYQKGEDALLYIDLSAEHAARQALFDLGQGGGYDLLGGTYNEEESPCGTYLGFASWGDTQKTCFPRPAQLEDAFEIYFSRNLDEYLNAYPLFPLPLIDTIALRTDGDALTIIGTTTGMMEIPIGAYTRPSEYGMFAWPLDLSKPKNRLITSCIGLRDCTNCLDRDHDGTDIDSVDEAVPAPAEPVLAIASGTVVKGANDPDDFNTTIIDHGGGYTSRYLHLNTREVLRGDMVVQGQRIGTVGGAGPLPYGWHLHFEIRKDNHRLDPLTFYDLDALDLVFWEQSNCYYRAYTYPYAAYILTHTTP